MIEFHDFEMNGLDEIDRDRCNGTINESEARSRLSYLIALLERRNRPLPYLGESEDQRFILRQNSATEHIRNEEILKEAKKRLDEMSSTLSSDTVAEIPQAGSTALIIWRGNIASWERVFKALVSAKLIDATPKAWGNSFCNIDGNLMPPPKGGNAVTGIARDPTTQAVVQLIKSINP